MGNWDWWVNEEAEERAAIVEEGGEKGTFSASEGTEGVNPSQPTGLEEEPRSCSQNAALHLWFRQIAEALNDAGYHINDKQVIKRDLPFTEHAVKDFMFRVLIDKLYGTDRTHRLTKKEMSTAIEVFHRMVVDNWGISVPVPEADIGEHDA